jgi:hypothetical protein
MNVIPYNTLFPKKYTVEFNNALAQDFRSSHKHWFYALMYGSYTAQLIFLDFQSMYLSGGEL